MSMTCAEYLSEINARYADYPTNRAANLAANAQAVEALMGLCGEVGEIADLLKKHWMYDKPLDQRKLLEEFGDVYHYFIRLADQFHFTLPVIMDSNAKKLRERFKDGYSHEAAIQQAEREVEVRAHFLPPTFGPAQFLIDDLELRSKLPDPFLATTKDKP